jgi:hypothetical protein
MPIEISWLTFNLLSMKMSDNAENLNFGLTFKSRVDRWMIRQRSREIEK